MPREPGGETGCLKRLLKEVALEVSESMFAMRASMGKGVWVERPACSEARS